MLLVVISAAAAVAGLILGLELARRYRTRRRVWVGAFLEQARRENESVLPYRHDQRVTAIQQRLSRHLGKRALTPKMRRRIERMLREG